MYVLQVELWKKFIAFEKSNPLRTEDTALITRRVMFATEQCLLVLTHHPAVWHQAAQYLDQSAQALAEKGVRIVFHILIIVFSEFHSCTSILLLPLQLYGSFMECNLLMSRNNVVILRASINNLRQCLLIQTRSYARKEANKTLCDACYAQHHIFTNRLIIFFYLYKKLVN